MSARGKVWAILIGVAVPTALLGVSIAVFSSNPLSVISCLTWMTGGGIYLLSYQDHEQ